MNYFPLLCSTNLIIKSVIHQIKMTEINSLVIIDHYKKLDRASRVEFRSQVLDATGMAQSTFYGKITGKFDFTKAERFIISRLIPSSDVAKG